MSRNNLSRRDFLAATGTAAACLPVARSVLGAEPADAGPLIIDCHAHIYSEDEKTYPPIAEPYRPPAG